MMKRVLLVDDDELLLKALEAEFQEAGFEVLTATGQNELSIFSIDYAVIDLRLGSENGLDIIDRVRKGSPHCKIVVLTGYGSIPSAVEAMKRGAINFLTKPAQFKDILGALLGESTHLSDQFRRPSLSEAEYNYIEFLLHKNRGNISKTARELGMHRQSLQRKLKKKP